jgi:multicomponent Na+:H+ antiporter subunit G
MLDLVLTLVVSVMLLAGGIFTFLAALGIVRLPDAYTRMHAASKAGAVGSGLMLFAAGLHAQDLAIFMRALAGFVFFILTAPVAAHLVAKAAHGAGYPLAKTTVMDDMRHAAVREQKKR